MAGSTYVRLQSDRVHVKVEHEYHSVLGYDGKACNDHDDQRVSLMMTIDLINVKWTTFTM